ncbi:MAG: 4-alpha-glucanotransferase [Oscillospiraceae bacterium]|nr:4-alpha-glucanotransferase [Oscillospiraceae bacterium]
MTRKSGILMHISSLPSKYGIGTFGQEAYDFVDFLEKSGQSYWQVLPMGPTDFGNSPYQSSSVFAGNPFFIDLEALMKEGLLSAEDCELSWGENPEQVDFNAIIANRLPVLRKAFENFEPNRYYDVFCKDNAHWLEDYALYMALKGAYKCPWQDWPEALRDRDEAAMKQAKEEYAREIAFHQFLQYKFDEQWKYLKRYANKKGVKLIGDIPIYTAPDSSDTWAERSQFQLDEKGHPLAVAGVPPDAFSETGQLWGNPLYDWEKMEQDGYQWWLRRMEHNAKLYDKVRIDHFRGLESYFAVPYGDKTAENGKWVKGPDIKLFQAIENKLGKVDVIAEDLGVITDDVRALLKATGFPGMKILQFAFDPNVESSYLPHNCAGNTVVYTGTHDNNTALGWFDGISGSDKEFVCDYLNIKGREEISWALVRAAWGSAAELAMAQMQDFLDLPESGRMNTPGTSVNNWMWRMKPAQLTDELAAKLKKLTKIYFR